MTFFRITVDPKLISKKSHENLKIDFLIKTLTFLVSRTLINLGHIIDGIVRISIVIETQGSREKNSLKNVERALLSSMKRGHRREYHKRLRSTLKNNIGKKFKISFQCKVVSYLCILRTNYT